MDLARNISEANWKRKNISKDLILNDRHPIIGTGFIKFGNFHLIANTHYTTIKNHFSLHNLAHTWPKNA